jgi:hypothetical protein
MGAKTGVAPEIRLTALKYPELSHSQIAQVVGCAPSNVTQVLKAFMGGKSDEELRSYQEHQADIFDSLAYRLLESVTQDKLDKTKPMEAITGAAILIDKARLVRGQATSINATVLIDLVRAVRAEQTGNQHTIRATSADNSPNL